MPSRDPGVMVARKSNVGTYNLTTTVTAVASPPNEIPFDDFDSGGYVVTAVSGATSLSFYGGQGTLADGVTSVYGKIMDSTNTALSQTITNGAAYSLPAQCQGFKSLLIVPNSGTATIVLTRKT